MEFKVSVFDQVKIDGEERRIEDLVGGPSRTELTFPMYANWDIELHCYDPATQTYHEYEGVRRAERAKGCAPVWPFQRYCSEYWWDDTERTCPDGEFKPETVFPICEEDELGTPVPTPWATEEEGS